MAAGAICHSSSVPMNPVSLFHPAVAAWFDRSFAAPTRGAGAGLAGDPGRPARADRGADRLRQDARRLPRGDRRAGAPGRSRGGLKDETQIVYVSPLKALSNDIKRNLEAPLAGIREALQRAGLARRRHPHLGAHRRHARRRARPHAPPAAAHRRDHAGIALHPARLGIRPRDAGDHADRDRRRDPRAGAEQARHPSGAVARAAGGAVRRPAAAHRPLGHAEADRGRSRVSWSARRGRRRRRRLHDRRYRPPPRARSRARSARLARSKR